MTLIRLILGGTLALLAACTQPPSEATGPGVATADTATALDAELTDSRRARIEAYVSAYQAGDPDAYRRWLSANRTRQALDAAPMDARLSMFADDAGRWGGLSMVSIEPQGSNVAVLRARPTGGGPDVRVSFEFDPVDDDRIGAMSVGMAIDLPGEWSDLDEFAAALQQASGIPAVAVGVLINGAIIDQAAVGRRRIDRDDPAGIGDTFHWGSIAKSVTGTMIAALVRDGALDWDTTVGQVLGGLPMRDSYRDATLWQAMSHQAGFPEYGDFSIEMVDAILARGGETWTDKRGHLVEQILTDAPLGPPGTVGRYSNAGITVAGYMAERVTGQSWRELVRTHVFEAVGMDSAGFDWPAGDGRTGQPSGHFGGSAASYEVHDPQMMAELVAILDPAGNVRSSIADLLRYGALHLRAMRAVEAGPQLRAIRALHQVPEGAIPVDGQNYTFGWGHDCTGFPESVRCHWHNGGAGSFYAELRIFPDQNLVLAYAANAAEPAEALSGDVMQAMFRRYSR